METISPTVEYIKSEMKRQDVSMPELAERMGRPQSTLWRILTGVTNPKIDTIEQIFAALKLPPIGKNALETGPKSGTIPGAGGPFPES